MDLLSCFHSSYTALLFSQRPSGSSKAPSDPVSAVSSQISHSAADGGQPMSLAPLTLPFITPHLISQGGPACSLLPRQYCWGKSFAHFTHSDLIWGNFLDGYVVEFSLWKFPSQSLGCIVVLTLYIPCFVLSVNPSLPVCALGFCEFVYLLWLCYIWPAALVFKRRLSELFSTHSQMSYAISALFIQDILDWI